MLKRFRVFLPSYRHRDTEVDITDGVAKINVPTALTFNQRWLMAKNRVASELFKYTGIKEIQLVEKLTAEAEVFHLQSLKVEAKRKIS